jgi:deazaflavin-dependent oxidoreductase (nitroreductase family)
MPRELGFKALNALHRSVLWLSRGRVGWRVARMQVIELTTVGRKSGRPRTVILTSPIRVGDALVVVASRGGDDRHPDWFLNLRQNPKVLVSVKGGPAVPMRARTATAEERSELWPLIIADHQNYAAYQTRTCRTIPVVLLEPSS